MSGSAGGWLAQTKLGLLALLILAGLSHTSWVGWRLVGPGWMELSEVAALLGLAGWAGECSFCGDDKGLGRQVEICEFV